MEEPLPASFPISQLQTIGVGTWRSKLAPVNSTARVLHLADPKRIFLPENMVRTSVLEKLRMRRQNAKTAVSFDAVPERRTQRCSPSFQPGDRFCELRFRYQSSPTGSEGEISRPYVTDPFHPLNSIHI